MNEFASETASFSTAADVSQQSKTVGMRRAVCTAGMAAALSLTLACAPVAAPVSAYATEETAPGISWTPEAPDITGDASDTGSGTETDTTTGTDTDTGGSESTNTSTETSETTTTAPAVDDQADTTSGTVADDVYIPEQNGDEGVSYVATATATTTSQTTTDTTATQTTSVEQATTTVAAPAIVSWDQASGTLAGTAAAGSTVRVLAADGSTLAETVALDDGTFSLVLGSNLDLSTVSLVAIDALGNQSALVYGSDFVAAQQQLLAADEYRSRISSETAAATASLASDISTSLSSSNLMSGFSNDSATLPFSTYALAISAGVAGVAAVAGATMGVRALLRKRSERLGAKQSLELEDATAPHFLSEESGDILAGSRSEASSESAALASESHEEAFGREQVAQAKPAPLESGDEGDELERMAMAMFGSAAAGSAADSANDSAEGEASHVAAPASEHVAAHAAASFVPADQASSNEMPAGAHFAAEETPEQVRGAHFAPEERSIAAEVSGEASAERNAAPRSDMLLDAMSTEEMLAVMLGESAPSNSGAVDDSSVLFSAAAVSAEPTPDPVESEEPARHLSRAEEPQDKGVEAYSGASIASATQAQADLSGLDAFDETSPYVNRGMSSSDSETDDYTEYWNLVTLSSPEPAFASQLIPQILPPDTQKHGYQPQVAQASRQPSQQAAPQAQPTAQAFSAAPQAQRGISQSQPTAVLSLGAQKPAAHPGRSLDLEEPTQRVSRRGHGIWGMRKFSSSSSYDPEMLGVPQIQRGNGSTSEISFANQASLVVPEIPEVNPMSTMSIQSTGSFLSNLTNVVNSTVYVQGAAATTLQPDVAEAMLRAEDDMGVPFVTADDELPPTDMFTYDSSIYDNQMTSPAYINYLVQDEFTHRHDSASQRAAATAQFHVINGTMSSPRDDSRWDGGFNGTSGVGYVPRH